MPRVPGTAVVIGGGAIGCEFASMMSDLGSQVTVLEALPKILPVRQGRHLGGRALVQEAGHRGAHRCHRHGPRAGDGGTVVNVEGGDPIKTDVVVVSVGRRPATDDLGLEGTQVAIDERGFVVVDELCRTGEDGVWAVGDCIATPRARPRGLRRGHGRHRRHPRRGAPAHRLRQGPWGIYCRPRWPSPALRAVGRGGRARRRGVSKHRYSPTAGPRSSATRRDW